MYFFFAVFVSLPLSSGLQPLPFQAGAARTPPPYSGWGGVAGQCRACLLTSPAQPQAHPKAPTKNVSFFSEAGCAERGD